MLPGHEYPDIAHCHLLIAADVAAFHMLETSFMDVLNPLPLPDVDLGEGCEVIWQKEAERSLCLILEPRSPSMQAAAYFFALAEAACCRARVSPAEYPFLYPMEFSNPLVYPLASARIESQNFASASHHRRLACATRKVLKSSWLSLQQLQRPHTLLPGRVSGTWSPDAMKPDRLT